MSNTEDLKTIVLDNVQLFSTTNITNNVDKASTQGRNQIALNVFYTKICAFLGGVKSKLEMSDNQQEIVFLNMVVTGLNKIIIRYKNIKNGKGGKDTGTQIEPES